jgi:transcriptional regulator with XRE-family HTH domain
MSSEVIETIKKQMTARNMKNKELADESGVSPSMVRYVLNEKRSPTLRILLLLGDVLGLRPSMKRIKSARKK